MARTTLTIDTVLSKQQQTGDRGGLLLANVQGQEGVSTPFAYDVMMYRKAEAGFFDIDPSWLLNTRATIGMRGETDEFSYRTGIFQSFEKDSTNESVFDTGLQGDFRVYRGRLVPAFQMLEREVRYRVFENKTVIEIMEEVMDGFPRILTFSSYVSTSLLNVKDDPLEKIPYCVQFGESSFNFLSRMMAQFDIWYIFDHRAKDSKAANETMVLGRSFAMFQQCANPQMDVVYTGPDVTEIAGFQRAYAPARKSIWASDFNWLNPTQVSRGTAANDPGYDLLPGEELTPYERDVFPAPFTKTGSSRMTDQAKSRMQDEENNVFQVQGQTKNPTFMAGLLFHIDHDKTKAAPQAGGPNAGLPAGGNYLITQMTFSAFETGYGHDAVQDGANFLLSPVRWFFSLFRDKGNTSQPYMDATSSLAGSALSSWVGGPNLKPKYFFDGTSLSSGISSTLKTASAAGLAQMFLAGNVSEIIGRHLGSYTNAFVAVPWDNATYAQVPGPDGEKPKAYGPHLAVVLGIIGVESLGECRADALGRVRVRFPWQRTLAASELSPTSLKEGLQNDPNAPQFTDDCTTWVPVSEAWAGASFGTQFLPRAGDQVLVSFLDGDPDRPIITGRVYHAGSGFSNLPFSNKPKTSISKESDLTPTFDNYNPVFSGIKTRSLIEQGNVQQRFSLLRFDDTWACEQVLLRSQGRLDVTAFSNSYYTTYGTQNINVAVGYDDKGKPFGGNAMTTVAGEYDLHIGGSRIEEVEKEYQLTVRGNTSLDLLGNLSAIVEGVASLGANSVVIEATNKITLKVGGSFIVIGPCGISIKAPIIYENSGGSPDKAASVTMLQVGDAARAEPGDDPTVRKTPCSPHGPPGGGTRPSTTDQIVPAPPCGQNTGSVDCHYLGQ
jgi:uncharacterized protein involved in type VI secretion and phage assembly